MTKSLESIKNELASNFARQRCIELGGCSDGERALREKRYREILDAGAKAENERLTNMGDVDEHQVTKAFSAGFVPTMELFRTHVAQVAALKYQLDMKSRQADLYFDDNQALKEKVRELEAKLNISMLRTKCVGDDLTEKLRDQSALLRECLEFISQPPNTLSLKAKSSPVTLRNKLTAAIGKGDE